MNLPGHLFEILEIVGTISFAVSGAMVAVRKRVDLFGVLVLGVITALGGGLLRDVILGQIPPAMFVNKRFVLMALVTSLLVFVVARAFKDRYLSSEVLIDQINNVFDALGLGAFAVIGSQVAISAGYKDNMLLVVCMGMITGIGGGLIRDLMVMEIPFVLRHRVYAVAAITGAILFAVLDRIAVPEWIAVFAGVVWVFGMRMLATKYKWNLPKAIGDEDIDAQC
ncbi:MAG: trimeric intracellular cation channel family protein [Lachnospiraceae bacterium]|nr:trimeric intracellular cation channel family protein [Lachnospiraceae bacterium]